MSQVPREVCVGNFKGYYDAITKKAKSRVGRAFVIDLRYRNQLAERAGPTKSAQPSPPHSLEPFLSRESVQLMRRPMKKKAVAGDASQDDSRTSQLVDGYFSTCQRFGDTVEYF